VAVDFYLSVLDPRADKVREMEMEYMHLHANGAMLAYFDSVRDLVDTAGLAELDPYDDRVWTPDEAGPVADQLLALYQAVAAARDTSLFEASLAPPNGLGYGPVLDFLFWLRRIFSEAGHRRMYVFAAGD
jgi:hypothetical protein